jgi:hypothetical protein
MYAHHGVLAKAGLRLQVDVLEHGAMRVSDGGEAVAKFFGRAQALVDRARRRVAQQRRAPRRSSRRCFRLHEREAGQAGSDVCQTGQVFTSDLAWVKIGRS